MGIIARGAVLLASVFMACAVTACGPGLAGEEPQADAAPPEDPPEDPAVTQGREFALANCSSCHAVVRGELSPNPQSPPFEAVANRPGLTAETLVPWLNNSHFFPDIMNFDIEPGQVENLASYMLTLQHEDYRPIPQ